MRTCCTLTAALVIGLPFQLFAQDVPASPGTRLPAYARTIELPGLAPPAERFIPSPNALHNIMITGYWPPTNEMIREFSNNLVQNPGGWIGGNWEGRGYNVYAYFPEFPNGLNKGEGDFEVDYQDTSGDWWPLIDVVKPVAIITFSRASNNQDWEMEGGNRTYESSQWTNDYLVPLKPTPELPIMIHEPPLTERFSSLPMQAIVDAVDVQVPALNPFISPIDNGRFLSNFIGYHGNWTKLLNEAPGDPERIVAAGHIHVGWAMTLANAQLAAKISVRTLITHVDFLLAGDMNCDRTPDLADVDPFVQALLDPDGYNAAHPNCNINRADVNLDTQLDGLDILALVERLAP